jgi:hypothetical protein
MKKVGFLESWGDEIVEHGFHPPRFYYENIIISLKTLL